jgi:hypothetical protein
MCVILCQPLLIESGWRRHGQSAVRSDFVVMGKGTGQCPSRHAPGRGSGATGFDAAEIELAASSRRSHDRGHVQRLEGVAKMDALKRLPAETAAEFDALLPAIFDKAFKGDL